ncbi:hypothetical protein TIFTF001_051435 [Ficus carica]|uniref:Uncharacterized protein n=1 Tax=Ficus carica TaxID=3494 RepID=A0AA88CP11_FICCA|nr:hypothetical protein TIFTF001_051435 [Ficus carica]
MVGVGILTRTQTVFLVTMKRLMRELWRRTQLAMSPSSARIWPLKTRVWEETGMPWYFSTFCLISKTVSKNPTSIMKGLPFWFWGKKIKSIFAQQQEEERRRVLGGFS